MLLDIFCGTKLLTDWSVFWLSLPILAHSGLNPWIYAFHHGEMRIAAGKIAENLLILFGIYPSRYGCSPMRRSINFQLSDINKNNDDEQRPPVEDCFAAKSTNSNYYTVQKKQSNIEVDISPEDNENKNSKNFSSVSAIIEEDVNDLAKMLEKDYINNRNRIIDKNYNIKKLKNLKYLLDPTFNKIRHLRHLNSNNNININNSHDACCKNHRRIDETKFKSYQNLKSELVNNRKKINAISEPMLNNTDIQYDDEDDDDDDDVSINELLNDRIMRLKQRRDSGLSSLSDPNIKSINNTIIKLKYDHSTNYHGHSIQNLDKNILHNCQLKNKNDIIFKCRKASRKLTITANKLTNLFNNERQNYHGIKNNTKNIETIVGIDKLIYVSKQKKYLEANRKYNLLTLPRIRSEPPTPVEPLDCLEEESSNDEDDVDDDNTRNKIDINFRNNDSTSRRNSSKCAERYSDPIVPYVLLNIENFDDDDDDDSDNNDNSKVTKSMKINPIELSNALLKSSDADRKLSGNLFNEHYLATRFNSRRPSDLRWFESSRSQEALSNIDNHKLSPSSYSVNNYTCTSGSDLNDTTFTDSFICPDPLTSSLRESFFDGQTDNFTSFDDTDTNDDDDNNNLGQSKIQSSVSSVNFNDLKYNSHSKSTGSVIFGCRNAILKINKNHTDCVNIRISDSYCNKYKNNILSPVNNEIFDGTGGSSGVRV